MRDFLTIFQFLLKQTFSPQHFANKFKHNKRQRRMYLIILFVLIFSLPSYGMFISTYVKIFDTLQSINQGSLFIMIGVFVSIFVIIVVGLYQIISNFYFSNEVKILTTYPIKTNHILLSKLFVIYVFEVIISLFTVFPFFLIYGIKTGITLYNWVYLVIAFLLLPIIPLVFIGIVTVLIMKGSHAFKHRDAIRMIGMFLFFILLVSVQIGINRLMFVTEPGYSQQEMISQLISDNQYLIRKAERVYPVIGFVKDGMTSTFWSATVGILLLTLFSVVAIYVFLAILKSVFLKSYLSEQESHMKKSKKLNRNQNMSSVSVSIAKIDFITMLKVPIYAFNCLISVVIVPLLLLLMVITNGDQSLDFIRVLYDVNQIQFWLIIGLVLSVFAALTPIAPTSFSREGKTNWIMRTLPISSKDHLLGRFITPFYAQVIATIISIGIILVLIKEDYLLAGLSSIISIIASIPLILLGLFIDLKRPMLKWDNPQQAVKQNLNVLVSMAVGLIYGLLIALIYIGLKQVLDESIIMIVFILLFIILSFGIYKLVLRHFEQDLIYMED